LSGLPGNGEALKKDLADLGVFDTRMSLYLALRLREFCQVGFCGLESRYYSLFPGFREDMAPAVDLQNLIAALSFRYVLDGHVTHAHIPDSPFLESERRQVFFGAAIGIPTFFVRQDTDNLFLKAIVEKAHNVRPSRRYAGYLRVHNIEYCRALLRLITENAADLVDLFSMKHAIEDLRRRLDNPECHTVAARLTKEVLGEVGVRSPLKVTAEAFNAAAEDLYRNRLRRQHLSESLQILEEDLESIGSQASPHHNTIGRLLYGLVGTGETARFLREVRNEVIDERAPADVLRKLISTVLLTIHADRTSMAGPETTTRETGT
jgi:hypothetical protein